MPTNVSQNTYPRVACDATHVINGSGDVMTMHPLVNGVSVTLTYGAGASVTSSGKAVTITVVASTTTIAGVQALLAASTAATLLSISGTGAAVFASGYGFTSYPLWTLAAMPVCLPVTMGSDGYWWASEADGTSGMKVSQSSRIAGEDLTADRLMTLVKCSVGSGGILTASGTLHSAPCVVRRLVVRETGGSSAITVVLRDGGSGGTVKTVTYVIPASGGINEQLDLAFGTDVYLSVTGTGTPSAVVYVV
ncbi:MAG: hypothetical protein GYA36_19890 [Veillonellaceae bacterium]|nr:hypothetical protein [Veillonellaceae bacterium]